MMVRTLSLVQKGKTRATVDAVHSGIVVFGGGDIVFGAKRSKKWMQCAVDTVE